MRSNRKKLVDAPGTRKHTGRGLCSRCYARNGRYELKPGQYEQMLIAQSGRCAACSDPMSGAKDPAVDHNHETGEIRALLCNLCNVAEGMLLGDPSRAFALAIYMERHLVAA